MITHLEPQMTVANLFVADLTVVLPRLRKQQLENGEITDVILLHGPSIALCNTYLMRSSQMLFYGEVIQFLIM
jgi:hypothetical protein